MRSGGVGQLQSNSGRSCSNNSSHGCGRAYTQDNHTCEKHQAACTLAAATAEHTTPATAPSAYPSPASAPGTRCSQPGGSGPFCLQCGRAGWDACDGATQCVAACQQANKQHFDNSLHLFHTHALHSTKPANGRNKQCSCSAWPAAAEGHPVLTCQQLDWCAPGRGAGHTAQRLGQAARLPKQRH